MTPAETRVRVRWGDTDAGGLIYFPRYFGYFVAGFADYLDPVDHVFESLRQGGYVLPSVDVNASFEEPLRAGDAAIVETRITQFGEASLTAAFRAHRADGYTLTATGAVTFVLVDENFEPTPLPDEWRAIVAEQEDSTSGAAT